MSALNVMKAMMRMGPPFHFVELGLQFVQKQRLDEFEDVGFAGVVRPIRAVDPGRRVR